MPQPSPFSSTWAASWLHGHALVLPQGTVRVRDIPRRGDSVSAVLPLDHGAVFALWLDTSGLLLRRAQDGMVDVFPKVFEAHRPGTPFKEAKLNHGWNSPGMAAVRAEVDALLALHPTFPALPALPAPWATPEPPLFHEARRGFLRAWLSFCWGPQDPPRSFPIAGLRDVDAVVVRDDGERPLDVIAYGGPLTYGARDRLEQAMARFSTPRGALYQDRWKYTSHPERPSIVSRGIERDAVVVDIPRLTAHQILALLDTGVLPDDVAA